jgi:tRNA threonylcarbamoyl adenosine modification protein (Sua5/YciO/YrdC/YwlC family)
MLLSHRRLRHVIMAFLPLLRRGSAFVASAAPFPPRVLSSYAATVVPSSDPKALEWAGRQIRDGRLVAFPTETVYGLGASVESETALANVFTVKERPRNDPLICHVLEVEDALALYEDSKQLHAVVYKLAESFWPGPLTIVARAASTVSPLIHSGTGLVGCRSPKHLVARQLLWHAGVAIAAPSANKFGHVSPTSAAHVLHDLGESDIVVLESPESCAVGIESTVARVDVSGDGAPITVRVLRAGAVTAAALRACLTAAGMHCEVTAPAAVFATPADGAMASPGQLLKHYAPTGLATLVVRGNRPSALPGLGQSAVLDLGGRLAWARHLVGAARYADLSAVGSGAEAATALFAALRRAEAAGGDTLLVPDLSECTDDAVAAVWDRLFRSASGRFYEGL